MTLSECSKPGLINSCPLCIHYVAPFLDNTTLTFHILCFIFYVYRDFSSKYERVEMQNSLARQNLPENTPVGGGWVFSANGYGVDYDDESTPSVALRSISPIPVATPLLKIHPSEDPNGVPDSGHGGSIPPDDSAIGFSPSLEEDIELELSPFYRALGTSIGSGSEVRDHSYTAGDSDTISEGNEPVVDNPIREVHFNSFGAKTKTASEEAMGL